MKLAIHAAAKNWAQLALPHRESGACISLVTKMVTNLVTWTHSSSLLVLSAWFRLTTNVPVNWATQLPQKPDFLRHFAESFGAGHRTKSPMPFGWIFRDGLSPSLAKQR